MREAIRQTKNRVLYAVWCKVNAWLGRCPCGRYPDAGFGWCQNCLDAAEPE